ncbi:hypothetical protein GpartN1_g5805.t1 [Galdieria partita]|uniref:RWD domain-containing protein n=1 Tax=Galdieria partita TaxID=83374 RepID=A0A9C7Q1A2_9RHOD|nr:hypothetical protein GpartN1_g5805.t1 [Galdieria partita]
MKESLAEERQALKLIYGEDLFWNPEQETLSVQLFISDRTALVQFYLPSEYPQHDKPQVLVQARWVPKETRHQIVSLLRDKFDERGGPILYEMTEFCREKLQDFYDSQYGPIMEEEREQEQPYDVSLEDSRWHHKEDNAIEECCLGQVLVDRKSVFQGLVIEVDDENKIDNLLNSLHQHRKIGSATHLIASWRIVTSHGHLIQDWDDDGEKGGGQRILQLLVNRNIHNVLLVVCRWFGGILLGPVRFHHIQQAAKSALDHKYPKQG